MRPKADIDACRASHRRLVAGLVRLTEDDLSFPSLLPRYTRRHVVAHLANKTVAHVVVFGGPAAGEVRRLHPDGYDADAAAEASARRSGDELRSQLEQSLELLEETWDSLDDALWAKQEIMTAGPRTMSEIITHHMRDVEVHHVDLDIGYRPSDWPSIFVERELVKRLRSLPSRAEHSGLLGWLLGRTPSPELGPW